MSADNYYLVIDAGDGQYTAVSCSASCIYRWQAEPDATGAGLAVTRAGWVQPDPVAGPHDPRFATPDEALAWACDQYSEYGATIHPAVQARIDAIDAAKRLDGWIDPVTRRTLIVNDVQYHELANLLLAHPDACPSLHALVYGDTPGWHGDDPDAPEGRAA